MSRPSMLSGSLPPGHRAMGDVTEKQRLREVHRYRRPVFRSTSPTAGASTLEPLRSVSPQDVLRSTRPRRRQLELSSTQQCSPDMALTAFAQLASWRLDMKRAIISLVDEDEQYFLAESTRTLDLASGKDHDDAKDGLWKGCAGSRRDEALCSHTINAPAVQDGYSIFSVCDLTLVPEFSQLPYVIGPPYSRFYAGTPLVSKDGIRVGSFFVMDDKPRDRLLPGQVEFLGTMATNVMNYLELQQQSDQKTRNSVMAKGLAAFVDGKIAIPEEKMREGLAGAILSVHAETADTDTGSVPEAVEIGDISEPVIFSPDTPKVKELEPESTESMLFRASALLRESLDVDLTIFFDSHATQLYSGHDESQYDGRSTTQEDSSPSTERKEYSLPSNHSVRIPSSPSLDPEEKAAVIAFSALNLTASPDGLSVPSSAFGDLPKNTVQQILKIYPVGKVWSFEEDNTPSLLDKCTLGQAGFTIASSPEPHSNHPAKEYEALRNCFPGIRQALFVPLQDPITPNHALACFAVTYYECPVLESDNELAFSRAFVANVAAEWDRASKSIADRQKGEFISSISHEFRSPLHGNLASTELLSDTTLDPAQKNLVETIETCGELLLSTISHILDYTKINNFLNPNSVNVQSLTQTKSANSRSPFSSLELRSDIDMVRMCEDVIEVVWASHRREQGSQLTQPSSALRIQRYSSVGTTEVHHEGLSLILDISGGEWMLSCIPGAFQRILMNLATNSLKYTRKGTIHIKLTQESVNGKEDNLTQEHGVMVFLTVKDTGIGMSEEFLQYKLFTPFAQESTLSPGTGLGLSIVKQIVKGLGGTISLSSQLGKGTEIIVGIPLLLSQQKIAGDPLPFSDLKSGQHSEVMSEILKLSMGKMVGLHGFETDTDIMLKRSLEQYITNWYNMYVVDKLAIADVVIVNEQAWDTFQKILNADYNPRIVVLLDSEDPFLLSKFSEQRAQHLSRPFGPYKLAKVLISSLGLPREALSSLKHGQDIIGNELQPELPERPKEPRVISKYISNDVSILPVDISPTNESTDLSPTSNTSTNPSKCNASLEATQSTPPDLFNTPKAVLLPPPTPPSHILLPGPPELSSQGTTRNLNSKPVLVFAPSDVHDINILCVDDNTINLRLVQTYLKKLGYKNVSCAMDGREAFEEFVERTKEMIGSGRGGFDLIFMDITMPVCDGYESTQLIRQFEETQSSSSPPENISECSNSQSSTKIPPSSNSFSTVENTASSPVSITCEPPILAPTTVLKRAFIVALTGLASSRDQNAAFTAGMDYFATKPLSLSHLRSLMHEWRGEGRL